MKEVQKVDHKSVEPEAALGNPGRFSGNAGLKASGLKQGETDNTTSDGGSDLESLRQGSKPKPEAVRDVKEDPSCVQRARKAWQAANGDEEMMRRNNIAKEDAAI